MTEFWKRKIRTYFNRFDIDGDGKITKQDFVVIANRFSDHENATPDRREELTKCFVEVWRKFMLSANVDETQPLTQDVMVESLKNQIDSPVLVKDFDNLIQVLFDIMDTNKDGYLQLEEWTRFFDNFNFPDTRFTKLSFYVIDLNYDDKVSIDEMKSVFFDFLFNQDPGNASAFFFGHLDP